MTMSNYWQCTHTDTHTRVHTHCGSNHCLFCFLLIFLYLCLCPSGLLYITLDRSMCWQANIYLWGGYWIGRMICFPGTMFTFKSIQTGSVGCCCVPSIKEGLTPLCIILPAIGPLTTSFSPLNIYFMQYYHWIFLLAKVSRNVIRQKLYS